MGDPRPCLTLGNLLFHCDGYKLAYRRSHAKFSPSWPLCSVLAHLYVCLKMERKTVIFLHKPKPLLEKSGNSVELNKLHNCVTIHPAAQPASDINERMGFRAARPGIFMEMSVFEISLL